MENVRLLKDALRGHLFWHEARIDFMARFLIALIQLRTVNLTQLALALNPAAQVASNYRRLQRFFADFPVDQRIFTRLLVRLLAGEEHLLLTLDRTMWSFGRRYLNVVMIGACYKGIAIPLVWELLPKEGATSTAVRVRLCERLFEVVDPRRVECLVADREFVGHQWLSYLKAKGLGFVIRQRRSHWVSTRKGRRCRLGRVFADLQEGQVRRLRKRRLLYGHRLYLVGLGHRTKKGRDDVLLATNLPSHRALGYYARRWEIETLFAALKRRGFELESTHLYKHERIEKLLGLLAVAFAWAHQVGEWKAARRPIPRKSHGRPAKSMFRYGLDHLRKMFLTHTVHLESFLPPQSFLSCT